MPSDAPLQVLALNASLKHEPSLSNTGELAALVLDEIRALAPISGDVVRLSDARLPRLDFHSFLRGDNEGSLP